MEKKKEKENRRKKKKKDKNSMEIKIIEKNNLYLLFFPIFMLYRVFVLD